ncbi:MAG: exodeoxyribonuclease III [Chloroherpetonaceae bacterium]|nr:exodeoxyribonuclease III [Chloroherpetonaceae bacterium]MCS7212276.1 exodeoxyribonuclease III [Chloroherpetonaceae bacterium]MDW8020267.1 exodeoxyribonuclease III [Chloroherpetonaceae bacterium]MDW8466545.1 exodeoxyribonuclease III [Chloroherpetonaceae bacterium]
MRLATWNINGIRAREKALLAWIQTHQPDVLVLQELKATRSQIPATLTSLPHYQAYWNDSTVRAGYSGVGALVHHSVIEQYGEPQFAIPEFDVENRLLQLQLGNTLLLGTYFPRGEKPEHYALKLRFFEALETFVRQTLQTHKEVIIAGDINVAREEIDLHPSQQSENATGFRPDERQALNRLLAAGLRDVFRDFYPNQAGLYTWFPYWKGARERNIGWRIDCVYASPKLASRAKCATIHSDEKSSDHYPVTVEFETLA